ncbi:MAG TPA: hypothetical protein VFS40_12150 [Gemmatimonadales bacterium]|nr:hypothetical protein [Gemmatimonadales bacterium]
MVEHLRVLRLACSVFGFAAAAAGVVLGDRRIVWVAIVLLGAAFLLRILIRRMADSTTPADERESGDDESGTPH